jgi:hypothetical protein
MNRSLAALLVTIKILIVTLAKLGKEVWKLGKEIEWHRRRKRLSPRRKMLRFVPARYSLTAI